MASVAGSSPAARPNDVTAFDRMLAAGAAIVFAMALAAVLRGRAEWGEIPSSVWLHLGTIGVATALTPLMLLRRRGDRLHRRLGYVWVTAMFLTALVSLDLRLMNRGGFSVIHILSVWTMIQVPLIIWRARQHDWVRHRSAVRGMVLGALLIAGFFTFPFNRLLGHWLFG